MDRQHRKQTTRILALMVLVLLVGIFGHQSAPVSPRVAHSTTSETGIPKRALIPDSIVQHEGLPAVSTHTSEAATSTARTVHKQQLNQRQVVREIIHKKRCQRKEIWTLKRVSDFFSRMITDGWHTYRHGLLII